MTTSDILTGHTVKSEKVPQGPSVTKKNALTRFSLPLFQGDGVWPYGEVLHSKYLKWCRP